MRETSPAVLMAEATIPVTTPIKEENGMDDLRVVYVKVKGEQEIVNAVMDTGAQMPVVRPDVVEGQSMDNRGSIQITSAFGEHEMGEKTLANDSQSSERKDPSKEEGTISSTDSKSVCSQEVITNLRPVTYTQSLLNVPNGDLVAVKINASNVQTNGQVNGDRYRAMITNFFIPELNNHDVQELWLQQDDATCHIAHAKIDLLKETFGDRLISRFGPVNWPPRSCN
ncbi:uncharacterized protein TNCV_4799981 [Trichonephila clavipes]|uniref:Uncharacterized protein n=1 Tax=Trichonephila clavipes TaxID=2585209 RepID=A0A8X6RGA5_TRICX|nr:uncharacterized protein TNCV_4799981 [Trichonephila clavipes]